MCLVDVKDDGDYKLVIADQVGKLKIYMGTNVIYNERLGFDKPVAVEYFYDQTKKPLLPIIAVAAGSSIYYYQNYLPHMKFDLPLV
jgi:Ciliary BBSome complex subunit 1